MPASGAGAMAKCLCHELDHLDGVLYTDKALEVWPVGGEKEDKNG